MRVEYEFKLCCDPSVLSASLRLTLFGLGHEPLMADS
jgi:hypothetical protein